MFQHSRLAGAPSFRVNRHLDALEKSPGPFSDSSPGINPSRETPLGPGAKKDGCFRRLVNFMNLN